MDGAFLQNTTNVLVVLGVFLLGFPWACSQLAKGVRILKQASWAQVDAERKEAIAKGELDTLTVEPRFQA